MPDKRIFVGNLPENVTEDDLKSEFSAYGPVKTVELKSKTNAFDEVNRFAFLTIDLNDRGLGQCIQEFKEQKYKGNYLSVSLAKESFLDRLKREREEAGRSAGFTQKTNESSFPVKREILPKKLPELPTFSKDEDDDDDDSSEEENEPKSNIDTKQNVKILQSDQKRTESLRKMAEEYQKKKLAIKSALSNIDHSKNKIKFDYDEDQNHAESNRKSAGKTTLFEDDDNEDEETSYQDDFRVKQQFQGEKGQKLLELQTRFKNDKRFQMDQKFVDDDNQDVENMEVDEDVDVNEADERNWQLGILENVVGKKFDRENPQQSRNAKKVTMTRFDPTREDHYASARPETDENLEKKKNKKSKEPQPTIDEIEVSKEMFYKISDNFTTALKSSSSTQGFSLLNMFGQAEEPSSKAQDTNGLYDTNHMEKKKSKIKERNPFKYDSSDSEDDVEIPTKTTVTGGKTESIGTKKNEIFRETFFFVENDQRFLDGAKFFRCVASNNDGQPFNRSELKKVVKNKVKKTQKKFGQIFRMKKKQKK